MTDASSPAPEPIRFFGTTWVAHGAAYWLRRVGVSLGALLTVAAGALVLRFAVGGVRISQSGGFVTWLLVAAIALCSFLAALRTWKVLAEGPEALTGWMAEDKSLGAVWLIGCVGAAAAYFARSLLEAPGEGVHRAAWEAASARYDERGGSRSGRPGKKRRKK
ncbi:membrane protein [Kitasatospora nipponensis]|uniref:Membrane protein n=1 Tax=Kitasatospora nipponensis TaxID=258049 RepID=A0ABN1VVS4_9ACTN